MGARVVIEPWMVRSVIVLGLLVTAVALLAYSVSRAVRDDEWPSL